MISFMEKKKSSVPHKILSSFIAFTFIFSSLMPTSVSAQTVLNLPTPGMVVPLSPAFTPVMVNGITIHPTDPLKFDFLIDTGDSGLQGEALKNEAMKLVRYFLASLTTPEEELWVNLSPHEKDRIISQDFGVTEMGRDLLAQDYMLKQLTASLMNPDEELGKKFWDKVYQKVQNMYGTTDVPINTFNKVWIVPEKAVIYEHNNNAFILDSHLKVMLEEDFLALQSTRNNEKLGMPSFDDTEVISGASSDVLKEVLIPTIEKEVNEGETFAQLRQIYHGIILASWYKQALKESLLGQIYVDKHKTLGLETADKDVNQQIYNQYLAAFKKGVHDLIREDYNPATDEVIPRKYFSGGVAAGATPELVRANTLTDFRSMDPAQLTSLRANTRLGISLGGGQRTTGDAGTAVLTRQDEETGRDVRDLYPDVYTPEAVRVLKAVAPLTGKLQKLRDKREERFIQRQKSGEKINFLPAKNPDGTDALIPGTNITVMDARNGNFEGSEVPEDLQRQWIQLTGPAAKSPQDKEAKAKKKGIEIPPGSEEWIKEDLRNVAHALLSGADGMMFDGEDALGQLDTMSLDNIRALTLAYEKDPLFLDIVEEIAGEYKRDGKRPADWDYMSLIEQNFTTRLFRPRGLHLDALHTEHTSPAGQPEAISATIEDIALYVTNNYKTLQAQGSSIVLYLPKLQTAEEAAFMAEIMDAVERELGLEQGTIKAFVLIEQLEESYQLMEMRAALGKHFVGFNTGRWDYIADVVKQNMRDNDWVPPNFKEMTMEYPFMWNYEGRVVRAVNTPDKNGNSVLWIGGMEPQIPVVKGKISKEDKDAAIENAMQIAERAKLRELTRGASGTWVAHPGMVQRLRKVYEENLFKKEGKVNQLGIKENIDGEDVSPQTLEYNQPDADALIELKPGARTIAELRFLISVALQYGNAYLTGRAAAALKGADFFPNALALFIMEDMATGEGRTKLTRKWGLANAELTEVTDEDRELLGIDTGARITPDLIKTVIGQEYEKLQDAPDDIVFGESKTKELPIAKMAVETFLTEDTDLPWLIDLLNMALNESDLEKATEKVKAYVEEYKRSGGITRLTENPQFVAAPPAAVRADFTFEGEGFWNRFVSATLREELGPGDTLQITPRYGPRLTQTFTLKELADDGGPMVTKIILDDDSEVSSGDIRGIDVVLKSLPELHQELEEATSDENTDTIKAGIDRNLNRLANDIYETRNFQVTFEDATKRENKADVKRVLREVLAELQNKPDDYIFRYGFGFRRSDGEDQTIERSFIVSPDNPVYVESIADLGFTGLRDLALIVRHRLQLQWFRQTERFARVVTGRKAFLDTMARREGIDATEARDRRDDYEQALQEVLMNYYLNRGEEEVAHLSFIEERISGRSEGLSPGNFLVLASAVEEQLKSGDFGKAVSEMNMRELATARFQARFSYQRTDGGEDTGKTLDEWKAEIDQIDARINKILDTVVDEVYSMDHFQAEFQRLTGPSIEINAAIEAAVKVALKEVLGELQIRVGTDTFSHRGDEDDLTGGLIDSETYVYRREAFFEEDAPAPDYVENASDFEPVQGISRLAQVVLYRTAKKRINEGIGTVPFSLETISSMRQLNRVLYQAQVGYNHEVSEETKWDESMSAEQERTLRADGRKSTAEWQDEINTIRARMDQLRKGGDSGTVPIEQMDMTQLHEEFGRLRTNYTSALSTAEESDDENARAVAMSRMLTIGYNIEAILERIGEVLNDLVDEVYGTVAFTSQFEDGINAKDAPRIKAVLQEVLSELQGDKDANFRLAYGYGVDEKLRKDEIVSTDRPTYVGAVSDLNQPDGIWRLAQIVQHRLKEQQSRGDSGSASTVLDRVASDIVSRSLIFQNMFGITGIPSHKREEVQAVLKAVLTEFNGQPMGYEVTYERPNGTSARVIKRSLFSAVSLMGERTDAEEARHLSEEGVKSLARIVLSRMQSGDSGSASAVSNQLVADVFGSTQFQDAFPEDIPAVDQGRVMGTLRSVLAELNGQPMDYEIASHERNGQRIPITKQDLVSLMFANNAARTGEFDIKKWTDLTADGRTTLSLIVQSRMESGDAGAVSEIERLYRERAAAEAILLSKVGDRSDTDEDARNLNELDAQINAIILPLINGVYRDPDFQISEDGSLPSGTSEGDVKSVLRTVMDELQERPTDEIFFSYRDEDDQTVNFRKGDIVQSGSLYIGEISDFVEGRGLIVLGEVVLQVLEGSGRFTDPGDAGRAADPLGGIDFNPVNLNMLIKRDGKGVPVPVSQQPILNMNIDGFIPVIINVTPINNLPLLLGLNEDDENPAISLL